MSTTTKAKSYVSCHYVGRESSVGRLVEAAKSFAGRNELDGRWEIDENGGWDYWGAKNSVNLVRAFCDGYFSCLANANPNLRK